MWGPAVPGAAIPDRYLDPGVVARKGAASFVMTGHLLKTSAWLPGLRRHTRG
jgi:hypothetical protein